MGQFSWIACDNGKQIVNGKKKDVYVLIPEEFGGGHYIENCYDGYGNFAGHDIFDLVADWNRNYITVENMIKPQRSNWDNTEDGQCWYERAMRLYEFECKRLIDFSSGKDDEYMQENYGDGWKREIGINIACYDEQNAALKYPIKIAHNRVSVYEKCKPSDSDPDQGWENDNDDCWY